MSDIVLSNKAAKLMKLCELQGFAKIEDVLFASTRDAVCPAICVTEGCDHTGQIEPDQEEGYCEACGGNTMVSALVLAGYSNGHGKQTPNEMSVSSQSNGAATGQFLNFYRCERCGHEWTDMWSATCDDDCPLCGARHMSPYQSEDIEEKTTSKIALLNDSFRTTFVGGQVVITGGVHALSPIMKALALIETRHFSDFTPDNDPYQQHDFGSFEVAGERFFWKIDLYEEPGVKGTDGEPAVARVLTIMLAEEY